MVGDKRTRTADICRAKAALYQLSYIPNSFQIHQTFPVYFFAKIFWKYQKDILVRKEDF
jgi:hypothetical protein